MPRRRRRLEPGLLHHVYTHAVSREDVFRVEEEAALFLDALTGVVRRLRWEVHAACLMPNHLHLVVGTPEGGLDVGMRRLLGEHAAQVNSRYDRRGHLFRGRYENKVVTSDAYHAVLLRYVAANPVKHGFCRTPLDWRWSTHAALAGRVERPEYLSFAGRDALFGGPEVYAAWVGRGEEGGDLLEQLLSVGGSEGVRTAFAAGYSQTEIAARLGTTQQTVSRVVRGGEVRRRGQTPFTQAEVAAVGGDGRLPRSG